MTYVVDFVNDIELPLLNGEAIDTAHVQLSDVKRHTGDLAVTTSKELDETGALMKRRTWARAGNEYLRKMQQDPQIKMLGVSRDSKHGGFTADLELDVAGDAIGIQVVYAKGDMLSVHRLRTEGSGRLDWWDLDRDGNIGGYDDLLAKMYDAVMPF